MEDLLKLSKVRKYVLPMIKWLMQRMAMLYKYRDLTQNLGLLLLEKEQDTH